MASEIKPGKWRTRGDLIAPVHEITAGSYWRIKGSRDKWRVIGKRNSGVRWIVESEEGLGDFLESDFLEPWTDPPRTWTRYMAIVNIGNGTIRVSDKETLEKDPLRLSDVQEVTLTEKANPMRPGDV